MTTGSLPLPPADLAARVGTPDGADPVQFYLDEGKRLRAVIEELLPPGWDWAGKRALDFGCGAGRVLRQFAREAERGLLWGCDIDTASIAWARARLSPPFRFFENGLAPPLALDPGSLDLVWAMSVFTHIGDGWSDWLVEVHRVLAPDGILIASFLGEGMWQPLVGEPYREDQTGMSVLHHWTGPDAWVFHSEWWLREHWGRAFEVMAVKRPPRGADGAPQITHSYIALRRRETEISTEELERIDPAERRELAGLETSLRLARREIAALAAERSTASKRRSLRAPARALRRAWSRSRGAA